MAVAHYIPTCDCFIQWLPGPCLSSPTLETRTCACHPQTRQNGLLCSEVLPPHLTSRLPWQTPGKGSGKTDHTCHRRGRSSFPQSIQPRARSCCLDAALTLTHHVSLAHKINWKSGTLLFDISGFFDNINCDRLKVVLRNRGFSSLLVNWIDAFLTDRTLHLRFNNKVGPLQRQPTGTPQGSPLSPIISALYTAPLLLLSRNWTDAALSLYIDDGLIFASGPSWTHVRHTLQEYYATTYNWLTRAGLSLESSKTELIFFRCSHDHTSPPPCILLPDYTINSYVAVAPATIVCYLGFFIHHKLNWKHHVQVMANRTRTSLRAVKVLGNSIQGLNLADWRLLYHTIALPTLSYGSQLWWTSPKKQTLLNILWTAQNVGLHLITGVFHTTPMEPLHVLAHVLPIHIYLEKLCSNSALHLLRLPPWALPLQLLGPLWHTLTTQTFPSPVPRHRTCQSVNKSALDCLVARLDPELPHFDPHLITPWTHYPWKHRVTILPHASVGIQCRWLMDLLGTYQDGTAAITLLAADISTTQPDGLLIGGAAASHFRPGGTEWQQSWLIGTGLTPFDALTLRAKFTTQFALCADFLLDPYCTDPGITTWYLIFPDQGALQAMMLPCHPTATRQLVPFFWHLDTFLTRHTHLRVKLCWCPPDHDSPWVSEVPSLA